MSTSETDLDTDLDTDPESTDLESTARPVGLDDDAAEEPGPEAPAEHPESSAQEETGQQEETGDAGVAGWNWLAISVLAAVIVGTILRMWALNDRAMHHDESLDAWWSHKFLEGTYDGYDPVYHGPLRFYITAAFYWLFGENAATARLFSALSGSALIAIPWLMRRHIGSVAAVAGAWMLALSPSMLYYSRFAREDMQIAFLTALMLLVVASHFKKPRAWKPTVVALALSASLAIKESTWLLIFIVGSFVLITLAVQFDFLMRKAASEEDEQPADSRLAWLLPLGALVAMVAMVVIAGLGISAFVAFGAYGVGLIIVAVFSAARAIAAGANLGEAPLVAGVTAVHPGAWIVAGVSFVVSFVVMFTVFFKYPGDWHTGLTDAISYWQSQQDVNRGSQPWYYYLVLLPAYELLFLALAVVGAMVAFRQRTFALGLIGWLAAASVIIFSYAGERMPWLVVHPLLPIILLAAVGFGFLWKHRSERVTAAALSMIAVAFLLTAGAGVRTSFANGTDGREFLSQGGQASEHVPVVVDYVETLDDLGRIADRTNPALFDRTNDNGEYIARDNPSVAMTTSDNWPMAWYFVDREIRYFDSRDGSPLPDSDIIIADWDDFATVWSDTDPRAPELERLNRDYIGHSFAMRNWWVPQWVTGEPDEDGIAESKVGGYFAGGLSGWGDWFVSREAWTPQGCGSLNQWLLIRRDLVEVIESAEAFGQLEPFDLTELECVDAGLKDTW